MVADVLLLSKLAICWPSGMIRTQANMLDRQGRLTIGEIGFDVGSEAGLLDEADSGVEP
jgi:hypothetical protein